jgi:hypothetical protein
MGFTKYREDDLDRRIENRAAVLDEFQPSFTQVDWPASRDYSQENEDQYFEGNTELVAPVDPPHLTVRDRIILRISAMKLQSGSNHMVREVLEDTAYWSPAHFEELARMSAQASARLNIMLARAYHDEPSEQEPSFRAVVRTQRSVVVEIRKRRADVLHLRHPDFW